MTQINKMAFSIGNDDIDLYLTAMKASEILQVATVACSGPFRSPISVQSDQ